MIAFPSPILAPDVAQRLLADWDRTHDELLALIAVRKKFLPLATPLPARSELGADVQKSSRPCENSGAHCVLPKFRGLQPRRAEKIAKIASLRNRTEPRVEFSHGLQELCTGVFLKRTNDFSGDTHHEAVRRNVLRDNRSSSDY